MRRRTSSQGPVSIQSAISFALDCQHVIAMRCLRIAAGGAGAQREFNRMIAEKFIVASAAQAAAMVSLPMGADRAAQQAFATYERAVRSNRRRMSAT